jgi:hypothetical protein
MEIALVGSVVEESAPLPVQPATRIALNNTNRTRKIPLDFKSSKYTHP